MRLLTLNEETARRIWKAIEEGLPHGQKSMAPVIVRHIKENRHGKAEGTARGMGEMIIRWATVHGEKKIELRIHDFAATKEHLDFRIVVPGMPEWREERKDVFYAIAPEIMTRRNQLLTHRLVDCWGLDLRLREGKDRWGEPVSCLQMESRNDQLQVITVSCGKKSYLVTKAGTFSIEAGPLVGVGLGLKLLFGFTGSQFRKPEGLIREIERQLSLREEVERVLGYVPRGRIRDVDPRYGAIVGKYLYQAGRVTKIVFDYPGFRTIADLIYGIYGDRVPEQPDIAADLPAPPWALRRFGEKRRAYLIDEDPDRELYVFLENGRFHLGFEKKTFRTGIKKRPRVAEAFRDVFGVELTPEMTREDIEAIAAMFAL